MRFGVQPSIGCKSKYFSGVIYSRFVRLSYFDMDGNLVFEGTDKVAYLKDNKSSVPVEPAVTLRAGLERLKVQLQ